jgi:phosphate transport system substrate-binding protein
VTVGGSGEGSDLIDSATEGLNVIAANISVGRDFEGLPAGFRRFCNGELDLVLAYRDMLDEEAVNCEANNITPLSLPLGDRAVVLLANAGTEFLACLTTEEITRIWAAGPDAGTTQWNEVNDTFPETAMTLFAPDPGNAASDLMLLSASGSSLIERIATEQNDDPLYRAAAAANVTGSLTYMSWPEYQRVLANNQANVQLVAVDGGSGCVLPATNTIRDGSYPLTRHGQILVNRGQLTRLEVQSLLWYAYSDDSLSSFEDVGYVGVRLSDLSQARSLLLQTFNDVAAEAQAEATEESVPEATAEATAEPAAD